MRLRLEEGGDVEVHVSKSNEVFHKLLALGDEIKPEFFECANLLGSARNEELTKTLVCSKVLAEYKRRTERKKDCNKKML